MKSIKLQELLGKITKLPWKYSEEHEPHVRSSTGLSTVAIMNTSDSREAKANAACLAHCANALPELVEVGRQIIEQGFNDSSGYNCHYCNAKTYGTGEKLSCQHEPDCLFLKIDRALQRAETINIP